MVKFTNIHQNERGNICAERGNGEADLCDTEKGEIIKNLSDRHAREMLN